MIPGLAPDLFAPSSIHPHGGRQPLAPASDVHQECHAHMDFLAALHSLAVRTRVLTKAGLLGCLRTSSRIASHRSGSARIVPLL